MKRRTLEDITTSGDLGFDGVIAYKCITILGIKPTVENIDSSILGHVKSSGYLEHINYTEEFFYEEIIFVYILLVQLAETNQYVQRVMAMYENAYPSERKIPIKEIFSKINGLTYNFAKERMICAGIEPRMELREFIQYSKKRVLEYIIHVEKVVQQNESMLFTGLSIGLEPRDTALKHYLGYFSDNICKALTVNEPTEKTMIQMVVIKIYGGYLRVSNEIVSL